MSLISAERIRAARAVIDPVFLDSPQYLHEALGCRLGCRTVLKLETLNPIRSFKGRGSEACLSLVPAGTTVTCASAGNFGQGLAYAARRRGIHLVIFAAESANPFKVKRMRELGAEVRLQGADFDAAKDASNRFAVETGALFIEDGRDAAIAEGAGTIAAELSRFSETFDSVLVPIGNGSLAIGIGSWFRSESPSTKVIGVCAKGAPAMAQSWRQRAVVTTEHARTIADGIAVRVPVPEALPALDRCLDEILLIDDSSMVEAMRLLHREAGIVSEPAGVAALAALLEHAPLFRRQLVALPICGSNATEQQLSELLSPRGGCCG